MASRIQIMLQALARGWRQRRRAANVRAGAPRRAAIARGPASRLALAGVLAGIGGAALIGGHARHLGAQTMGADLRILSAYQALLPGLAFEVPSHSGLTLTPHAGAALLIAAGMQAARPVLLDLCSQLAQPSQPRLSSLRLGYRFDDVRRWVARAQAGTTPLALRNVLLLREDDAAMPEVQISGMARADFNDPDSAPLQLEWHAAQGTARWVSDASLGQIVEASSAQVNLRRQGWLLWGAGAALRIERRTSAACAQAGELVLQMYRLAPAPALAARALVTVFPAHGNPLGAYLAAGAYQVPAAPRAVLEDQALFRDLQARRLLRLGADGRIETAPRDLAQWLAADAGARAVELSGWKDVRLDAGAVKLLKRLYHQADGAYVRQQIDIFNDELRLLAWRVKAAAPQHWQASAGEAGMPLALGEQMPPAAARLFADLAQGWAPWQRLVGRAGAGAPTRLRLDLARPAAGGERYELMLIGRPGGVVGARLNAQAACSGRACPAPDAVQTLLLTALPGARAVTIDVQALDMASLAGRNDQQYRHLRLRDGQLVWQAIDGGAAPLKGRAGPPSPVLLRDRNGALLWADGQPSQAARDAGLAPLLGLGPQHANSVAGMLARLPRPAEGRLTLDLALQTLSQRVLDCIGMRRGRWDGKVCIGGRAGPDGRHAGLVFLDAENGDVLAAAGAGMGLVDGANWNEVRDFDQSNPARSPLRLPAFQHDGGIHQSPGSTFKIISALGLEMAARSDPRIDALLDGMPLAAINTMARQRGFAFQTESATYPSDSGLAHITNYKEQSLDRRALDGRLGLAQALSYSLNTWFAWSAELSDASLFGRPAGGAPDLQELEPGALDAVRPIVAAAHLLGFERALRLDGGLLPADFSWSAWDALQTTPAHIDTIHTRHELRQMAIGLRMQATPLQMALAAASIGQGKVVTPRLLLALDGVNGAAPSMPALDIRLDRIRSGMKGVIEVGTGATAFAGPALVGVRRGLYGKTGTAPSGVALADGARRELATVWFTGWLEPGTLPGQQHRIAVAVFVSHSDASGGEHAAPVVAAVLTQLAGRNVEQRLK
ncbi:cell division protein FtsI/penicillin-binding protein 2 [Oxalobacteraceae bacterium GrIS 1.11]